MRLQPKRASELDLFGRYKNFWAGQILMLVSYHALFLAVEDLIVVEALRTLLGLDQANYGRR